MLTSDPIRHAKSGGWENFRDKPLAETKRISAILVVRRPPSELAIAALAIARNRGMVGLVHLKPDGRAVAIKGGAFGSLQQQGRDSAPSHVRRHRDGIKTRHHRTRPKQHDGGTGEAAIVFRRDEHGGGW